ncbi:MAG: GldG family protein [Treponema sp.]|nr:GldG family protein [Treponema sp.]
MTKKQTLIISLLTVTVIILALMVSDRFWLRLDLTKNKAYTISQVSRNLHREIPEPVNITYYVSDRLRNITSLVSEIEDTLIEYTAYSKGKIRLTVRDPVKAGVSRMVDELGLIPRQIQNVEQDQASFSTVYSGIVIEYLDRIDVLPWVIATETLEYDLTTRIRSLVNNTERVVGIIVGDYFRQWRMDFNLLNMVLTDAGYQIRLLQPGEDIPDNLPALFVLGGVEDFDDWVLYRIDRYIQLGGKVLFAVKGVFVDTVRGTIDARHLIDFGLLDMIQSYGAVIRSELVMDKTALIIQFQSVAMSGQTVLRHARYPLWIGVYGSSGNMDHPVSAGFNGVDLYWASPLGLYPPPNVEAVPLFTSTQEAWTMRQEFHTSPDVLYMMELEADESRGEKILGAALTGLFPSFFSGVDKPSRVGLDDELPDMPMVARASRIIVIGDTDFTTDMIAATQDVQRGEQHNLDLILRIADWLVNDDDIIGIRNRLPQTGRFDKILDETRRNSAMRFSQIVNVGLIPLFVIAAGFFIAFRRRMLAKNTEKENMNDI